MKDRFDLENEIQMIGLVADDIKLVSNAIMESENADDRIVNALEGIAVLLEMKSECLMDTMCQCFKLDQYRSKTLAELDPQTDLDPASSCGCTGCGDPCRGMEIPLW